MIPNKLVVGPYNYNIVVNLDDINKEQIEMRSTLYGSTNHEKQAIFLHPEQSKERMAVTLVHEALHCVWNFLGLPDKREEEYISALSPTIVDLFRRNSDFSKYVINNE